MNGKRKGLLHEKTFRCGYSIANETLESEENIYPDIDVDLESKLITDKMSAFNEIGWTDSISDRKKVITANMKELGLER